MDSRDIERLDQLLQFQRTMLEVYIRCEGMRAENAWAESLDERPVYTEEQFNALHDSIGFNYYPYYKG